MTVTGPGVTLQVRDDDKVLEPYTPGRKDRSVMRGLRSSRARVGYRAERRECAVRSNRGAITMREQTHQVAGLSLPTRSDRELAWPPM